MKFFLFRSSFFKFMLSGAALLLTGCAFSRISAPEETAIEQLLLSRAADRALSQADFSALKGRTVFVDNQYLDTYRTPYITGVVRSLMHKAGAQSVDEREKAAIILEPRSDALSIDGSESMFGIPGIPLMAFGSGVELPELPLYKKITQVATGRFFLHAYTREHGASVLQTPPLVDTAYYNRWRLLFIISFRTTDLENK